jgi:hypothetical protein
MGVRDGIGAAFLRPMDKDYFTAIFDDPEEAIAMHALYVDRLESARRMKDAK